MILAFLNSKGGSGKSTLALHVAGQLGLTARVLLIDADEQGSCLAWARERKEAAPFDVVTPARSSLQREIGELAGAFDFSVVDTPPHTLAVAVAVVRAADLVVIPCTPSPLDAWAARETVELVREQVKPPKLVFAINRVIVGTAIGEAIRETLAEYEAPILTATVGQRVLFAEALAVGKLAREVSPASPAAAEIAALTRELTGFF